MLLSFVNLKGGVGKTTSCVNIGAVLAEHGHDVLLVDVDPQASLTDWFERSSRMSLTGLIAGDEDLQDVVQATDYPGLDLIPTARNLANLMDEGAERIGNRLKRSLRPAQRVYDFTLIDAPPSLGPFSMAAVVACQKLIAPVEASVAAVDGLADTTQMTRRFGHPPEEWLGAFVTRVDMRTRNDQDVKPYLQANFPGRVFDSFIRQTVRVRDSHNDRKPTVYHSPSCTASVDYRNLTDELLSYV